MKKRIAEAKGITINTLSFADKSFSCLIAGIVTSFFLVREK